MVIHPSLEWLQDIEIKVQDAEWRYSHLDEIMESLSDYLIDVQYVLSASAILDICFEDMLGQGRYTELLDLHTVTINMFESDNSIFSTFDSIEHLDIKNTERFANEHFRLKLNFSQVALLLHNPDLAKQQLEHIRRLFDKATRVDQLEACCLFLKYHAYGYDIDLDFDLIVTTQRLANNLPDELFLKGEVAVAYYHYAKGEIKEMENVLRKALRLMSEIIQFPSETAPDTSTISAVMAELNFYLAVLYRELGDVDKAFSRLDIASEQYARLNNHVQNMLVHYETAMIYHHQNLNEKAVDWINLAFNEYDQLKEKQDYYQAMLEHGKAVILIEMKQYDVALTLFQRVLQIWEKQKHDYHIALATNAVGAVNIHLERPKEALVYFHKAKQFCEPIKDRTHVQALLKLIDGNIDNATSKL